VDLRVERAALVELRVERAALADAVAWTARTLPKGAGPLSGILVVAGDNEMSLSSFDLDMSSCATIEAVVEQPGQALVSGRLLVDIARSLPKHGVTIATEPSRVLLRCGRSEFVLPLMPDDEYPPLPSMPPVVGRTPGATFAHAIAQTAIATAKSDNMPLFTGIRMEIDGENLTLAATDRYRLAVRELSWTPEAVGFTREVIVPGRGLADVARSLSGAADVHLALSADERELGIESGGKRFTTRLLEGQFPRFRELLPSTFTSTVRMDTAELIEAVKRVALVAERHAPVRLDVLKDEVVLRAGISEETHATEAVAAVLDGQPMTIAFNPTFLLDGLAELEGSVTAIRYNEATKPAVIVGAADMTADPDTSFRYLLMPVKV